MKFTFAVEVEVKNDAVTQDSDPHDLAMILLTNLEDNKLDTLSWVIRQHYGFIKAKE